MRIFVLTSNPSECSSLMQCTERINWIPFWNTGISAKSAKEVEHPTCFAFRTVPWRRYKCCGWIWLWTLWPHWLSPRRFPQKSCLSGLPTVAPNLSLDALWLRPFRDRPSINSPSSSILSFQASSSLDYLINLSSPHALLLNVVCSLTSPSPQLCRSGERMKL